MNTATPSLLDKHLNTLIQEEGEYSQEQEQGWNTISTAEYSDRPLDYNDLGTNIEVSPHTSGNYNGLDDRAR